MDPTMNIHAQVGRAHLDVTQNVLDNPMVAQAVIAATAAGIPFITILLTILPFVAQILGGGAINWQAIIAAILALIPKGR